MTRFVSFFCGTSPTFLKAAQLAGLAISLIGAAPSFAAAQFRDPRPRTQPILVPATNVPAGAVQRLAWGSQSPDGWQLYSAGDDKIVRRWTLTTKPDGGMSLTPGGRVLWDIFHGIRGVIYALDAHPAASGDQLAFGGVGKHSALVFMSTTDPNALPKSLLDPSLQRRGFVVKSIDYAPGGAQVATAYQQTDKVLLWNVAVSPPQAIPLGTNIPQISRVIFSPNGKQVAIGGFDSNFGYVQVWNDRGAFVNRTIPPAKVYDVTWIDDETWLAATSKGLVDSRGRTHLADKDCNAVSLVAASPLTCAVATFDAAAIKSSIVLYREGSAATPLAGGDFAGIDAPIAASPDGRFIAAGGVGTINVGKETLTADVIRVWDVASQRPLAQVPDGATTKPLGGPIGNLVVVEAGSGGGAEKIQFAWGSHVPPGGTLPPVTKEFRLTGRSLFNVKNGGGGGVQPHQFRMNNQDARQLYLNRDVNEYWGPLPSRGQARPRSYAIHREKMLLALGFADGILVCDLNKLHGPNHIGKSSEEQVKIAKNGIVRGFYGHPSLVTCLAFSPDGSWLASGSLDGTICGWSLAGVGRTRIQEFGVSFGLANTAGGQRLQVLADPERGTPAWEAGFRKGQQVEAVKVDGVDQNRTAWINDPNSLLPGQEIIAEVVDPADPQRKKWSLASTASYDPLWTLFPRRDGNWAMWTPPGHFETNNGDVGGVEMHINLAREAAIDGVERGAVRLPASSFRDAFQDARLIVQSNGRPLAEANGDLFVASAKGVETAPEAKRGTAQSVLDFVVTKRLADLPREVQTPPSLKITMGPDGRSATFLAQAEGSELLGDMQLWLNGKLLGRTSPNAAAGTIGGQWKATGLRAGRNDLVGVVGLASRAGMTYHRTVVPVAGRAAPPSDRRLHFLGVGVTELDEPVLDAGANLNPLRYANHDVLAMKQRLQEACQREGSTHSAGLMTALASDKSADDAPNERNIRARLQLLIDEVQERPDDLAIVMFSSHGQLLKSGFRIIAKDTKTAEAPTNVTSNSLHQQLSQLSCRSLLILDTCHSQGVQVRQQLQDWPGLDLGPMVLASCERDEVSYEDFHDAPVLGADREHPIGHGVFTASLLEAICGLSHVNFPPDPERPWDADRDGTLCVEEFCQFAVVRTHEIANDRFTQSQTPAIVRSATFGDASRLPLWRAPPHPKE